jgi:hypothetical protein
VPDQDRQRTGPDDSDSGWDQEGRASDLVPMAVHLIGTSAYMNASLKAAMDQSYGMPASAVRTKTFSDTGKVWIGAVKPGAPDVRALRISKTMATASFGFSIPLRKLNFRLPPGAKLICLAKPVKGQKATFEIVIAEGRYEPRSVDDLKLAAGKEARLAKARAKRAGPGRGRSRGSNLGGKNGGLSQASSPTTWGSLVLSGHSGVGTLTGGGASANQVFGHFLPPSRARGIWTFLTTRPLARADKNVQIMPLVEEIGPASGAFRGNPRVL